MKITSYDGTTFASLNVKAGAPDRVTGPFMSPAAEERVGSDPLYLGMARGLRDIPVTFVVDAGANAETTIIGLFGALDLLNDRPRTLAGTLNDGTAVAVEASVGLWEQTAVNTVIVTFHVADPVWRETTVTTSGPHTISLTGTAVTVTNNGHADAFPTVKLTPTVQRATGGWTFRRTVTLVNTESRSEVRQPKFIDLGDTTALVTAGKALASGDDLRVFVAGRELPRTLMNWNTARTFLVIAPPVIPASSSLTVEIVYGNPTATPPFTLAELSNAANHPERFCAVDQYNISGTLTAGTTTDLTDTSPDGITTFVTNRFRGGTVQMQTGPSAGQMRQIASNDPDTIVVARSFPNNTNGGDAYTLWMSGVAGDGGQASSATANTLTDSAQVWGTNQWRDGVITIDSGTGAGQSQSIASNTATQVTIDGTWATMPDATSVYSVERQGVHRYRVLHDVKLDNASTDTLPSGDVWTGLWYQDSRYGQPGIVARAAGGVPGAWDRYLMLRNADDFAQSTRYPITIGGSDVDYFNGLDADRRVGQEAQLSEEGVADGVAISNPHGFDGIFFDYQSKNPNSVAQFTMRARGAGGEAWIPVVTDTTAHAALTPVAAAHYDLTALTEAGVPLHLYLGVLPADGVEIPSTQATGDIATMRHDEQMAVYVNLDNWSIGTLSAEQSVYDMTMTLKLAALAAVPPYDQIEVGGEGRRLFIPLNDSLWIRTDPDTQEAVLGHYQGDSLVREVPWSAVIRSYITDAMGNAVGLFGARAGALPPGATTVTGIEDDIGAWTVRFDFSEGYLA